MSPHVPVVPVSSVLTQRGTLVQAVIDTLFETTINLPIQAGHIVRPNVTQAIQLLEVVTDYDFSMTAGALIAASTAQRTDRGGSALLLDTAQGLTAPFRNTLVPIWDRAGMIWATGEQIHSTEQRGAAADGLGQGMVRIPLGFPRATQWPELVAPIIVDDVLSMYFVNLGGTSTVNVGFRLRYRIVEIGLAEALAALTAQAGVL